jgi:membrane protease YdiL (CAAX protease family)
MGAIEPKQVLLFLFGWIVLLILLGIGSSWVWVLWRLVTGQQLLPERSLVERRKTPWSSGTVLVVFLVYLLANVLAFQGYLWATGAMPDEQPAVAPATPVVNTESVAPGNAAEPAAGNGDRAEKRASTPETPVQPALPKPEARKLTLIELMSIQGALTAFLIVFLPLVVRGTSGTRLRDLGLSLKGWREQVVVGVVALLFLMPLVYGAQYLAMRALGPFDEQSRHPVEKMLREQFSTQAAVLAFLTAVVLAPLLEEMIFRGIFQNWLVDLLDRFGSRLRKRFADLGAPVEFVALTHETSPLTSSAESKDGSEPAYWAEDFASDEPDPHPVIDEWASRQWEVGDPVPVVSKPYSPSPIAAGGAIVLTSLVFASLHAGQWPAPIPIFILALGLGFIYQRTGSLLATISMHAVFNGTSTLMLFFGLLIGVPREAEKKVPPPAVEHNAPVEKVKSLVPGVAPRPESRKK